MLNFDFAMLILASLAGRLPQTINHFMKTIVPSSDEQWQTTPTKLTGKTGKIIETEKNCSPLTRIGKAFSHPSDATISFEDLSSTTDPTSRWGSVISPGGLLWSVMVLPPPPIWGYQWLPSLIGRGPWAGIISLGVIHIA